MKNARKQWLMNRIPLWMRKRLYCYVHQDNRAQMYTNVAYIHHDSEAS